MLDQLTKLIEEHAGSAITNNPEIPNNQNKAVVQEVAQQIFSGLQSQATSGNFSQLTSLFQGNTSVSSMASNPIVQQLISSVAGSLASKFGVSPATAQRVASSLLPTVMGQLVSKTNNPNDNSFDLSGMMAKFTGDSNFDLSNMLGNTGGIGGMLGKLF